jgi:LmbE family N-acetylglucosaminyl deacetylase
MPAFYCFSAPKEKCVLTMRKTIVSIGAHPDDAEIGLGGTLYKHRSRGDDVHIILCTLGGVSGDPDEREKEARHAANILGCHLHILDYPVTKLNRASLEFSNCIKEVIDIINPDRIYVHSMFDSHQVHVAISESVLNTVKEINQVLLYESISSSTTEFRPNAFVDITNFMDNKIESIKAHKSQSNRIYVKPNVIRSLANTRYIQSKIGSNPNGMAEAFIVQRIVL